MQELIWTNCWRKIYAEEAQALGYECSWGGSSLLIRKDGKMLAFVKPKNGFLMSDLVSEAEKIAEEKKQLLAKYPALKSGSYGLIAALFAATAIDYGRR